MTDRDESEWMVVDGDSVITNIFSPRYRVARDLEDQWELMRPGKTRYENWTNEQLQERFGNVEEKMEAMSLEEIIQNYQKNVEENCSGDNPFVVDESTVSQLKKEVEEEKGREDEKGQEEKGQENERGQEDSKQVDSDDEYETKDYYLTREDLEKMMNDDGTITIGGQRLKIEEIANVNEEDIEDKEVPFLELEDDKVMEKRVRRQKLKTQNRKRSK